MSITLNASTSSGFVQSADNSGEIELQSNGTTALKVNTNEGIQILNCLGVGNATPSTSGAGITFPATQSASSDANTLDDYEEGTWTPSYSPSGSAFSSITYGASTSGRYIKIGKMVYVIFFIQVSSVSGGSGTVRLTGFPFTPENITNVNPGCVLHLAASWGTYTPFSIDYSTGTNFNLKYRASVSGALDPGDINVTDLASNCFMRGCFSYQASA